MISEEMTKWFQRVKGNPNGMATTETLFFKEGEAQLKWWKQRSQVIIKSVQLYDDYVGKGLFTTACKEFVAQNSEVRTLKLENILEPILFQKLTARGWERLSFDELSLVLIHSTE